MNSDKITTWLGAAAAASTTGVLPPDQSHVAGAILSGALAGWGFYTNKRPK